MKKAKDKTKWAKDLGRLGGIAFREKYGREKFVEMGRKAMAKRWAGHVKKDRKQKQAETKNYDQTQDPQNSIYPSAGTIIKSGNQTWLADGRGGIILRES